MKQFRLHYISLVLGVILIGNAFIIKADITGKIPIVRLATKSTQLLFYSIMSIYHSEDYTPSPSDNVDYKRAEEYEKKAGEIGKWFAENQNKSDVKVFLKILSAALKKMADLLLPKNFFNPGPFRSI